MNAFSQVYVDLSQIAMLIACLYALTLMCLLLKRHVYYSVALCIILYIYKLLIMFSYVVCVVLWSIQIVPCICISFYELQCKLYALE